MTRSTNVHKAQSTIASEPIIDVSIYVNKDLPRFESLADAESAFARDAEMIADELARSLPGGTLDRLVAIMLMRKASSLIVRSSEPPGPRTHAPQDMNTRTVSKFLFAPEAVPGVMAKAAIEHELGNEVITVVIQGSANPDKPIYVCGGCGYAIRSSGCLKHPGAPMTLIGYEP